ncbi:hypothetical protein EHS25_009237 [Saitozyma podzolica]|uniref:Uncharacterized protein n=1 Tax=Saitozyma podzolica TaxID=1890683 RepID=A0A427YLD9_9TREE|nr:hypothetical protein EHS25_009237 [Saitozyma podzolica]
MEHSSSMKNLRTERVKGSPYSRPSPKLKKPSSLAPFATVKSLLSYVTSPFLSRTRSTLPTTINDMEIDDDAAEQRSESGSEDQWDGEPPATMQGQDVFSLAAAAGREGPEFDSRATAWRARARSPVVGARRPGEHSK